MVIMRRIACEHDKVFSGHLRHGVYAWICRACGSCGWSDAYDISRVNLDEYQSIRVLHGWATPRVLPPPPRVPVIHPQTGKASSIFAAPMLLFAFLFAMFGVCGLPLGTHAESVLPPWGALIGSGVALAMFTVCYVCWKKGL
jgi:hypothetical protein